MSSNKRKAVSVELQRRVRARREPSEELEIVSSGSSSEVDSAPEEEKTGSEKDSGGSQEDDDDSEVGSVL